MKELKEKKNTDDVLGEMSRSRSKFIEENNLDSNDATYHIIKRFKTKHHLGDEDEVITIGIPYRAMIANKTRFGATVNIYKSRTPKLFQDITEKFKRYTQDSEIFIQLDK